MTLPTRERAARPGATAGRIPSLDGLRAVSIALVIASHASATRGFPAPLAAILTRRDLGDLGVRIFFVISGFLITGLLIRERSTTQRISLGRFYLRRTLRIFPPFYLYVGVIALAALAGWIVVPGRAFITALTYTVNYFGAPWQLGHAWSLSVEEQFYLLWPPLLALVGPRRGLRAAIAFIIAAPLIRLGYHADPLAGAGTNVRFETVGDAVAVGCVLALARERLWDNARYRALLESRWFWAVPTVIALAIVGDSHRELADAVGITMKNVAVAVLVDWCVRHPAGRIGRVLNARPVAYVGVLSYSLYLWQEPFLMAGIGSPITTFPLNVALAAACAIASYYLVEGPARRLRERVDRSFDARDGRGAGGVGESAPAPALISATESG